MIRRLYFDVTGLPPTPEALPSLLTADLESVVDQLLASPHFGERWARHWLDVARYAESHGFEHDSDRPAAYQYRDFVIRALNADMPYDQFVRWQLAGDELAPNKVDAQIATGFLAAGVHPTQITIADAERVRYDTMDDMLSTMGSAMLATTIGCARCHDHRYDPIPTSDYYRMLSAFTATVRVDVDRNPGAVDSEPSAEPRTLLMCSEGPHVKPLKLHKSSEAIPDLYAQTFVLRRGDPAQKAAPAEFGFLRALTRTDDISRWMGKSNNPHTSGRRAALSYWITDVEAGAGHLLARVIVNRTWQHYFGRGLVATVNDFGALGERPSHPELLDWLATKLIEGGWRLKPLHKLILLSEAYRMADGPANQQDWTHNQQLDPANQYLWRRPVRRLEAEIIRDNALAVSGLLDRTQYGPGTLEESMVRRSIYFGVKRSKLIPMMQLLDWPDTLSSQGERPVTTTASQALAFLNDSQFQRMAVAFASRIQSSPDPIGSAYQLAFARQPTQQERTRVRMYLHGERDMVTAYESLCAALLSSNEFIYIE
ncbi:hypothetical protein F183_A28410 [Bryobacterales bacterium F-183]|nr:hypothetical protein F183_A28410 [Bryobacterales bacterium F-183]